MFLSYPPIKLIFFGCFFFPVNLSHVNWITRPAKRTQRKNSPSLTELIRKKTPKYTLSKNKKIKHSVYDTPIVF